jgi:TP901 family phage tail tape measure protein
MTEQTTNVTIGVDVDANGLDVLERLKRSVRSLQAQIKRATQSSIGKHLTDDFNRAAKAQTAFQRRQAAASSAYSRSIINTTRLLGQQIAGERQLEAVASRSFRQRMSFSNRMAAQRAGEERQEQQAHRNRLRRIERERAATRRLTLSRSRDAFGYGRDVAHRLTRGPAVAAAAGMATTGLSARRILSAEADVDAAEVNTRIYGGLSQQAARDLRNRWAVPLAEQLGATTSQLLSGYTEALKVGIPTEGAKAFSKLSVQASEAWGVDVGGVVDTLGTINTLAMSSGQAFSFDRIKSMANGINYLAAKMSTTPQKLIDFMERGAGAAQILNMSQELGLALGAASTSLGNQAAESGRMFDYVAGRLVDLPRLVKQDGEIGKQARDLVRSLGYRGVQDMDKQRRANPDEFLFDFIERFNRIKDPRKREEAIKFFTGQEWFGEFGRLVTGIDTLKEAERLAKESRNLDSIGDTWKLHQQKLLFVGKQIRAGFLNILGELGKELSPLARKIGDYFLTWAQSLRNGGLQARFKGALEGFLQGFGFQNLDAALNGIFGRPGEKMDLGTVEAWKATTRGFAAGVKDVFDAIKSTFSVIGGRDLDAEGIARWTGRLMTLAAVATAALPLVAGLSALSLTFLALAKAAGAVSAAVAFLSRSRLAAGAFAGLTKALRKLIPPMRGMIVSTVRTILAGAFALKASSLAVPSAVKAFGRVLLGFAGRALIGIFSGTLWLWLGYEIGRLIVSNWSSIKSPTAAAFGNVIGKLATFIGSEAKSLFGKAADAFTSGLDGIADRIVSTVTEWWKSIRDRTASLFTIGDKPAVEKQDGKQQDNGRQLPLLKRREDLEWWETDPLLHKQSFTLGQDLSANLVVSKANILVLRGNTFQNREKQGHDGNSRQSGKILLILPASLSIDSTSLGNGFSGNVRHRWSGIGKGMASSFSPKTSSSTDPHGFNSSGFGGDPYAGGVADDRIGRTAAARMSPSFGDQHVPLIGDGTIPGLNKAQTDQYANILGNRESGNRYGIRNGFGFSGRWQMGAAALADTGYVRPGTTNRSLDNPANWTGKDGINSLKELLANKSSIQDKQLLEYTAMNHRRLKAMGVISENSDPKHIAGALAAAHLQGPGGAAAMLRGRDNSDANGTKASSYYRIMQTGIDRSNPKVSALPNVVLPDLGLGNLAKIPVKDSGGNTVMMDPRQGFGQAFSGGETHGGVLAAAQAVTTKGIAGGLRRFTAFNDRFHAGRSSKHPQGLAGDLTIRDPRFSAQAAEQLREEFRQAGLTDRQFKVLDEYRRPSAGATGGHLQMKWRPRNIARTPRGNGRSPTDRRHRSRRQPHQARCHGSTC